MRTNNAPTIRLEDYEPPAYRIDAVNLTVRIHPTATRVFSTLGVVRCENTPPGTPLRLDGDELSLKSIQVDDAVPLPDAFEANPSLLTLHNPPTAERFTLITETEISPSTNTKLMGLYQSNGVYCTQCEAEGFRRITYFLDRPDVLAVYTVRIEADKEECPLLLSNGNPGEAGTLPDGRHFAVWNDPHPKPSYLFAMVAGDLDVLSDMFETASGQPVTLNIYVEKGKAELAQHAMESLKKSMLWDEQQYGREYDLDVFNIVAVSDFNMGAMENKGLNIFNDKYILANTALATDTDYENIEAIVAHEYFHNWTGNRITCRDWFQLCLKEGLTVYRDQEFSADMRSRPVQRIKQVRTLKAGQFQEDAGALAHPVRPSAYKEINNFYTATVYQKGAELVRMLATIVGPENYRKATDLYFERHDGEAARVEDFLACFEDASGQDLSQFMRWYGQAGTPEVRITLRHNETSHTCSMTIEQQVPPTPGQKDKRPVPIPLRFGFLSSDGDKIAVHSDHPTVRRDDLIVITDEKTEITFSQVSQQPVLSILRGFSAPVVIRYAESEEDRLLRSRADSDLYNRWEALNGLALESLAKTVRNPDAKNAFGSDLLAALTGAAADPSIDAALRAQTLSLPSAQDIALHIKTDVDPDRVVTVRRNAIVQVGKAFAESGMTLLSDVGNREKTSTEADAAGWRALKHALLMPLLAAGAEGAKAFAVSLFDDASNMTDRLAALSVLILWSDDKAMAEGAIQRFFDDYQAHPLVIDKWFAIQASIPGPAGFERVKNLVDHPAYTLENPNRARALIGPFAGGNISAFWGGNREGLTLFADLILKLDRINPQIAARLLTLANNWRSFDSATQAAALAMFERIDGTDGLSRDTKEIAERSLAQ